jgi:signal transduction histidine kinase/phage shock protein PspC (stress-responsive transcriptional regulator)
MGVPTLAGTEGGGQRRLRRRPDRALIGGVCAGVADYLEVEPLVVRLLFIVIVLASGIGAILYPLAWALIPSDPSLAAGPRRSWRARARGWLEAAGFVVVVGIGAWLLRGAGLWLGDEIVLPLVLASCGVALIVRQAGLASGSGTSARVGVAGPLGRFAGDTRWTRWPGGALGVVLVLAAAGVYLHHSGILARSHHVVGGMILILVVLVLLFGPWFARLGRSLANERSARIRSQERADVAAHLHDSVLQTLALIQRRADDSREVAGLARRQERELRRWLYERGNGPEAATFAGALQQVAAEVEDLYQVRIEVVTVGDRPLDGSLLATVSATREAMINAAKFAGEDDIALYAEAGDHGVQVFVRDRGVGFDLATIPEDRHGVRHSILERMQQHGGQAEIRSTPGGGTEVELAMERPGR